MDYRRFIRQAMMLTLTTGLLASCSKDNNVGEPEADELIEIIPSAAYTQDDGSISNANSIIGPVDNSMLENLTFAFARRDQSHPVLPQYSYSSEHILATYNESLEENKAELQLSPKQYYLTGGLNTEMQGWYPPIEHIITSNEYPTVTFNFDGHQDILISNVLTGNVENIGINNPKLFTFQHQLTQLQFQVTTESEIAAQQWGKVTNISLTGESDTYMYVMLNSPTGAFSGTEGIFNITLPQNGIEITTNEITPAGNIMIKPREISIANDININITTTNDNTTLKLSEQINSEELKAGNAYKVTLNFLQGEITIKLTPADWEAAEGPENVDLAENQSYVISDMNYIFSRNMFGDAEGWIIRDETWTTTPTAESETSIPVILEVATENLTNNATLDHIDDCPEGWRMPSKTELELIQKYKSKLTKEYSSGSYIPIEGFYWSGTQNAAGATYYIDMATGEFGTASEEDGEIHHIRCVRDVEM